MLTEVPEIRTGTVRVPTTTGIATVMELIRAFEVVSRINVPNEFQMFIESDRVEGSSVFPALSCYTPAPETVTDRGTMLSQCQDGATYRVRLEFVNRKQPTRHHMTDEEIEVFTNGLMGRVCHWEVEYIQYYVKPPPPTTSLLTPRGICVIM